MEISGWRKMAVCIIAGIALMPAAFAQEIGGDSVTQTTGGGSAPPQNPPTCPIEYLGEINGIHYYVTSNCANVTGYGSSPELIAVPQCQPGGMCGQPLAGLNLRTGEYVLVGLQPPDVTAADIAAWKAETQALKAAVERGVGGRAQGDTRREQLANQLLLINPILDKLNTSTITRPEYDQFKASMDEYKKSFRFVGLAQPNSQRLGILDAKSRVAIKTAAETSYSTANVVATRVRVTATKSKVLKVQKTPQEFVYFQCFDVTLRFPGDPTLKTLKLGIQVKADGIASAEVGTFSERGSFAHRLRDTANNPYLVNSIDSLEP